MRKLVLNASFERERARQSAAESLAEEVSSSSDSDSGTEDSMSSSEYEQIKHLHIGITMDEEMFG